MTAVTPGNAELLALADHHATGCSKFANGECMTMRCLKRGGLRPGKPVTIPDSQNATCEAYETAVILRRLAAKPAEDGPYLVWSNQHRAWWRPYSAGYTTHVHAAGRYSREEAMSISSTSRDGWRRPEDVPEELAIAERDLPAFASTTEEPKR